MRILVIGGGGHIGSFLVPRLVRAGHRVTTITRGSGARYTDGPEWHEITRVIADRDAEEAAGRLGKTVLAQRPEVVIDLVCFTLESATSLVTAVRGRVEHLIHCGSLWRYGASLKLPICEDSEGGAGRAEPPFDEYGIQKDRIARMLRDETDSGGLVTTSLHPGHVTGPGWFPIGPLGNLDPTVWSRLAAGTPLPIPDGGTQMLHHVHADDVAQAFERAVDRRPQVAGADLNIVSGSTMSARGFATIAAGWFGRSAVLEDVSWQQFRDATSDEDAELSWRHLHRSHYASIDKARRLLGYAPRFEPEDAVRQALRWLHDHHRLNLPLT